MLTTAEHLFETRTLIVKHFCADEGCPIDDDAARAIAAIVVTDSIRELEGAVIRVVAYASLTGQPLSIELAESALAHSTPPAPITFGAYMCDLASALHIIGQVPPLEVEYRPANTSTMDADVIDPSISHVGYYRGVALCYIDMDAPRPEFWIVRSSADADDGPGLTCYAFTRDERGQDGHIDFVWRVDSTDPRLETVTVREAFLLYSERTSSRSR